MTRKERTKLINHLKYIGADYPITSDDVDEIIKALEQEPCEDAVSRKSVLDKKELVELEDGQSFYCISSEDVETLPSIALQQQPCEDCISRQEMLNYQQYLRGKMPNEENHKLWEFIKELPSVTPKPKTGHWIKHERAEEENGCLIPNYECSCCHSWFKDNTNFCPNCGAKMESEE